MMNRTPHGSPACPPVFGLVVQGEDVRPIGLPERLTLHREPMPRDVARRRRGGEDP